MKTPREKYLNDPQYHSLVQMLEGFIEEARFTPSEIREAAILACINYEMRHVRGCTINPEVESALHVLEEFATAQLKRVFPIRGDNK